MIIILWINRNQETTCARASPARLSVGGSGRQFPNSQSRFPIFQSWFPIFGGNILWNPLQWTANKMRAQGRYPSYALAVKSFQTMFHRNIFEITVLFSLPKGWKKGKYYTSTWTYSLLLHFDLDILFGCNRVDFSHFNFCVEITLSRQFYISAGISRISTEVCRIWCVCWKHTNSVNLHFDLDISFEGNRYVS